VKLTLLITLLAGVMITMRAGAQTDYRNLEQGRPTAVEDAYPLERYGFELSAGYRHIGGIADPRHLLEPELMYGFARGAQVSVRMPLVVSAGSGEAQGGLAGIGGSFLLSLSTERVTRPGLAVRVDGSLPAGAAAGHGAGISVAGLATRSFGSRRVHLNALVALDAPDPSGEAMAIPLWWVGAALDQTLIRSSTLLVAEGTVSSGGRGLPATYSIAGGLRRQLAPTLVLDLGVGWEFQRHESAATVLTLGISHAFAVGFLMPVRAP
jgi:hypothetical protein